MFSTFPNLGVFDIATAAGSGGTFSTFCMESGLDTASGFTFAMGAGRAAASGVVAAFAIFFTF